MKLQFKAKTISIYSTTLSNNIVVNLKLNDIHDFPTNDAKRLLQDFPDDFIIYNDNNIINNKSLDNIPKAKIKYMIVNKRNNALF
jgi:hypothetical protein